MKNSEWNRSKRQPNSDGEINDDSFDNYNLNQTTNRPTTTIQTDVNVIIYLP